MLEDDFQNKKSDLRWDLRENNLSLVNFFISINLKK